MGFFVARKKEDPEGRSLWELGREEGEEDALCNYKLWAGLYGTENVMLLYKPFMDLQVTVKIHDLDPLEKIKKR